jgi:hypothetical protein
MGLAYPLRFWSSVSSYSVSSKCNHDLRLEVAGQAPLLTCSEVVEVSVEVERHFTLDAAVRCTHNTNIHMCKHALIHA